MAQLKNEIWKPTFVNPYYLVSNLGRIRNLDRPIWCKQNNSYSIRKGKILKPNNKNSKKYWRIRIPLVNGINKDAKMYSVHRLVATAFIPNPDNLPQINHIDGNKDNNCVENLEWCDNGYNCRHAFNFGLKSKAKMSAHSSLRKLTEEQVCFIKQLWKTIDQTKHGEQALFKRILSKMFNLKSCNTISWIVKGGTNKFFNQDIVQTTKYDYWLSEYKKLYEEMKPKRTIKSYAEELGVNESSFRGRFKMFNRNIEATVNYYKQLLHM